MRYLLFIVFVLSLLSGCASTRTTFSVGYNQYLDPQTTLKAEYRVEQTYGYR